MLTSPAPGCCVRIGSAALRKRGSGTETQQEPLWLHTVMRGTWRRVWSLGSQEKASKEKTSLHKGGALGKLKRDHLNS